MAPVSHSCASCGTSKVALYDDHFERYFCDAQCHSDYCTEHYDEIYELWAQANLEEVDG